MLTANFDSTWHFLSSLLIIVVSLIASTRVGRLFGVSDKKGLLIFVWHTLFCYIYYLYSLKSGADSINYYLASVQHVSSFRSGTSFINLFTSIFSKGLGFSYLGCILIFNFIGYIGLIAFCGVLQQATFNKTKNIRLLALLCVFLPSISFWSSSIGKDSIAFLSIGLILWAALNFKRRMGYFVFAIAIMALVRPHIAAIILASYTFAFVFDRQVPITQRLILGIVASGLCAVLIPFALAYAGLGDAQNASDVEEYVNTRQGYNADGGSSIDIASMSYPMKMFTFFYRPLPFEAHSIFALAASLDNILLLIFSFFGLYAWAKKYQSSVSANRIFLWIYIFLTWSVLAITTPNLGIAMRQKWMFAPVLFFLILSVLGTSNVKRASKS